MKYLCSILSFSVSFLYWECNHCKDYYETKNMPELRYYFPYATGSTIVFKHNGNEEIFVASALNQSYDERAYTPKVDGEPCPNYYHTQHLTQYLQSSSQTIAISRYVDLLTFATSHCEPCQWSYKITIDNKQFEAVNPQNITDVTINNTLYANVYYITATNDKNDTLYYTDIGIIRIVLASGVYNRVN